METRPKPKLELSFTDKFIEGAGKFILLLLWVITFWFYEKLPEIIPTHFNGAGEVNDYGSKMSIVFLPAIATLLFLGLTVLNMYPHAFNYPVKITSENAYRQYSNATRMIRSLKLVIAFVFTLVVLAIYQAAGGNPTRISIWYMPVVMGVIVIPMGYFIFKAVKER